MTSEESRRLNQAAVRSLRPKIDREYPPGHFVAIYGGEIIADAATLDDLHVAVVARGLGPREVLAIQAGVEQPEFVAMFPAMSPPPA